MPAVQIEITHRCEECRTIFMMTNINHGKCPYCDFEVTIIGLDLDNIKIVPKE